MTHQEETYKVGVEVTNFPEDYRLVSALKTYVVDPAVTPGWIELVGPDPTIEVIEVFSPNDSAMVIQRSTPIGLSGTATGIAPIGDAVVLSAGNSGLSRFFHGPGPLFAVALTGGTASRVCLIITRRVKRSA